MRPFNWGTAWSFISRGFRIITTSQSQKFQKIPILFLVNWDSQKFDYFYFWCSLRYPFLQCNFIQQKNSLQSTHFTSCRAYSSIFILWNAWFTFIEVNSKMQFYVKTQNISLTYLPWAYKNHNVIQYFP